MDIHKENVDFDNTCSGEYNSGGGGHDQATQSGRATSSDLEISGIGDHPGESGAAWGVK